MNTTRLTTGGTSPRNDYSHLLDLLMSATDQASVLHAVSGILELKGIRPPWSLPELTPLPEYVQQYLQRKARKVAPSTLSKLRRTLQHFQRHARGLNVQDVRPEHVQQWLDSLAHAGLASQTVCVMYRSVSQMFARARSSGFISSNPCAKVSPPPAHAVVQRLAFELTDVARILSFMDAEGLSEWALVTVLGQEGLRLSDAARLTYEDLERRSLSPSVRRRVKSQARQTGFLCPSLASQPSSALSLEFVRLIERAGVDPLPFSLANGRQVNRLSFSSLKNVRQTVGQRATGLMSEKRLECNAR